jgi:hypothetical protein
VELDDSVKETADLRKLNIGPGMSGRILAFNRTIAK